MSQEHLTRLIDSPEYVAEDPQCVVSPNVQYDVFVVVVARGQIFFSERRSKSRNGKCTYYI